MKLGPQRCVIDHDFYKETIGTLARLRSEARGLIEEIEKLEALSDNPQNGLSAGLEGRSLPELRERYAKFKQEEKQVLDQAKKILCL